MVLYNHDFYKMQFQENSTEQNDAFVLPSQVDTIFYVSHPQLDFRALGHIGL